MKNNQGMAAIITVIILGALMVLIGSVMTLTSISEGQSTLSETKAKNNQSLLDACAEEALIKINKNNALPTTIITSIGSCTATLNSQVGTNWNLTLNTIGEMSYLGINLILDRDSIISISSWTDQ